MKFLGQSPPQLVTNRPLFLVSHLPRPSWFQGTTLDLTSLGSRVLLLPHLWVPVLSPSKWMEWKGIVIIHWRKIQYNTTVFYTAPRTRERSAWVAFITTVHFHASAFGTMSLAIFIAFGDLLHCYTRRQRTHAPRPSLLPSVQPCLERWRPGKPCDRSIEHL